MDNMEGGCVCAQCCHPACPPVNSGPPYDEVSHEIDNNIISIKVGKDAGKIEKQDSPSDSAFDAICSDIQGKRCREGCTKVNVISNQTPPPKRPEEEMLLLRSIRQFMPNDDLKNTLEIEFKAPRNYKPLPQPGPPPPIIIPKCNFKGKKGKQKGEGRSKAKKK